MATKSRAPFLLLLVAAAGVLAYLVFLWVGRLQQGGGAARTTPTAGGELVASLRSEPAFYNRFVDPSTGAETIALLTHSRLVRVNRATDELEPGLAESWTSSADGRLHTLKLRRGIRFSDGAAFTAADVLFTFRVLYDTTVNSPIALDVRPGGKPLDVSAPDPLTVVVRSQVPFAPGVRILDQVPIFPRHKLEVALNEGRFRDAWKVGTPFAEIAGLGPFMLSEHVAGQRVVFVRNPHYWGRDDRGAQLPYLDKITAVLIPDQNTEALRVEAGEIDVMTNGDIRPEDYAAFRRAAGQGRLRLIDAGLGLDPNLLWFNLRPSRAPGKPWFDRREFRQAISYAVDRRAIVNAVFLGEAVPVYGPVSPGNRTWYSDAAPKYEHDPGKARELLASIGLRDTNGDGTIEDASGKPVRFSILTQRGHIRERTVAVLQEHLRQVGIQVDVVGVDTGSLQQRSMQGDFDTIYYGFQASSTDPALNSGFWFSSGFFHLWNPGQPLPATEWERRVDELMHQQTATLDLEERQRLMAEAQRIIGEEMPAVWFVVPKNILAVSSRVINPTPARQAPHLLWRAETLGASGPSRAGS